MGQLSKALSIEFVSWEIGNEEDGSTLSSGIFEGIIPVLFATDFGFGIQLEKILENSFAHAIFVLDLLVAEHKVTDLTGDLLNVLLARQRTIELSDYINEAAQLT